MLNSQTGHIGFAVQATKGTYAPPSFFTKYANDDIGIEGEPIIPDAEIGGSLDITDVYPGPTSVTGSLQFDVRPNFVGLPIYLISGTDDITSVDSGVKLHTITPANEVPWFSAEKKVSDTYSIFTFTDLKLNTLTLSCEAGAQLVGQLDVRGITESGVSSASTPAYESNDVLMWHSAEIKIDNTTICPTSVSIEINNNLADDDYRICPRAARGLGNIPEGRRELNISVNIKPDDADFYKKANYGSATATAPENKIYKGSFWAKFESVGAITGEHKYFVELNVPHLYMQPFKISPSGSDTLEHGLDMTAFRPTSDLLYEFKVQNSVDSYTA